MSRSQRMAGFVMLFLAGLVCLALVRHHRRLWRDVDAAPAILLTPRVRRHA